MAEDPGCSQAGRYDIDPAYQSGQCPIRSEPCPTACLLKVIRSKDAQINTLQMQIGASRVQEAALEGAERSLRQSVDYWTRDCGPRARQAIHRRIDMLVATIRPQRAEGG